MMDEDELDPRIQVELEKLNSATDVINKLEIELDEANTTFRMLLNECTRRLKVHSSKNGNAIENARPYYEALEVARKAQQDCQQAAVNFQRANEVHEAAKETVALAESRFMSQQPEWRFDSAWQEMLNHATIKVRDAEKQRAESSAYHSQATARYKEAQEKVQLLEQRLRRNVAKSRPYFEEKQRCNEQLAAQKEAVETLAAKVSHVKSAYAESLRRLEGISEEIHRKRGDLQADVCGVREPGVGAELVYKGEQERGDASRQTTFTKANYNHVAKLNASDLPDDDSDGGCSAIHSKDWDRGLDGDDRRVVGNFQSCGDTLAPNPDILNDLCASSDILQEISTYVQRKVSFESLHGLYFNPGKDSHRNEQCGDTDAESAGSAEVCSEAEFVYSQEAGSSVSQGKFSLSKNHKTYGEAINVEDVVREETGATDNSLDIRSEVNSTEHSDGHKDESAADVSKGCDKLSALTLSQGTKGAKREDVEIANAAREVSTSGEIRNAVGGQGDVGATSTLPSDETVPAVVDDPCKGQTTFAGTPEDSCRPTAEQKSAASLENSNTLFNRPPDLELSFLATEAQFKDNDGDSALTIPMDAQDNVHDKEVPTVGTREALSDK